MTLRNLRMVTGGSEAHPCHVVVAGRTSVPLTCGIEAIRAQDLSKDYIRKQVSNAAAFFDWMLDTSRGMDPLSSPAAIVGSVKRYLASLKCSVRKDAKNVWITVTAPRERRDAVNALLAGLRCAYQSLFDDGHYPHDQHPLDLSVDQMREQRMRAKRSGRKGKRPAALSDALFRLTQVGYCPPRRTQVALIREVVRWAEEAGWPESLLVYLRILYAGGCRPSEPSRFRVRDWYEATRCGAGIQSPDKTDPQGRPKVVRFEEAELDALRTLFDGARYDASPEGERLKVADVIRLGDAGELDKLEQPLLLAPGGGAWILDTISRMWWRPLMLARCVDPVTGRPPIRMPTMHWLRHLFVYDHLALIELDEDEEAIPRRKELLVGYIGWATGLTMLATYGKEFEDAKIAKGMAKSMGLRTQMAEAIRAGATHWAAPSRAAPRPSQRTSRMLRDRGEGRQAA